MDPSCRRKNESVMTQEEIIERLIAYLDQHLKDVRGYIGQEPYKGDFFKLFKEAHRNGYFDERAHPRLTGDSLSEIVVTRWFTGEEAEDKKREHLMHQLFPKWDEWRYAWNHYEE